MQWWLNREVALRCLQGKQTLHQHRWEVLEQVAQWLHIREDLENVHNGQVLEELMSLFSQEGKRMKQIPTDIRDWERLLKQWLNHHQVMNRDLFRLLAVDGFSGEGLKKYLHDVLDSKKMRREYQLHARAVRDMYQAMDAHPHVSSLVGTDSACVIFLALLKLFTETFTEVMLDSDMAVHLQNIKRRSEMGLHRNANYYKDVHAVTDAVLDELGEVYKSCGHDWSRVGKEQLYKVVNEYKKLMEGPPNV